MGWQDRRYEDHEETFRGRARRALRRIFVEGDDFFSWSLPLFRVAGIGVRIHLLFVVYIIAELLRSFSPQADGFWFAAYRLAALFGLVLLHEFGHAFACRRVGGEADRILLWPLGGLAYTRPPHNWKANLVTTLGGPGVNLLLVPVFGGVLLALGAGWESVIYNPFAPSVGSLPWYSFDAAYWKYGLFYLYHINLVLLLFNMLLVMFPMDAGRIVQELLWWRLGYRRSMLIATNLGLMLAVAVGTLGLLTNQNILFGVALFCGITCFTERKRVAMLEDETYDLGSPMTYGYGPRAGGRAEVPARAARAAKPDREFERARRKQESARELQAEVDRILGKIKESGMPSLTRLERKTLEEDTRRKRGEGAGVGAED